MIRIDCFAYKNESCKALKKLYCQTEECGFYKAKFNMLTRDLLWDELEKYRGIGTVAEFQRLKKIASGNECPLKL